MKISPTNWIERCRSKGVLYLPYLPLGWSCIEQSLYVNLIFFHNLVCWSFSSTPWEWSQHVTFSYSHRDIISAVSTSSKCCWDEAFKGQSVEFLNGRQIGKLGQHYKFLKHRKLLQDWILEGHLCAVSKCSAARATEMQYYTVSGCKARLQDGFWGDTSMRFQVSRKNEQLKDNTGHFMEMVGSGWGKETRGNHCKVLDAKGGWGLCTLQSSSRQGRKLEDYIREVHGFGKLDEAMLLRIWAKCETSETYVNSDRTRQWSHMNT